MSAKMEQLTPRAHSSTETPKSNAKAVNFAELWKRIKDLRQSSEYYIKRGEGNFKMVGNLHGIYTCSCPIPLPSLEWYWR